MTAEIFNIQRYCLYDGPGIRTTVFFKGCPLNCLWCHNPESQKKNKQLMYYESKCTGCGKCLSLCNARKRDEKNAQYISIDKEKCILCGKCIEACPTAANEFCGRKENTEEIFKEVLKDEIFYGKDGGMTLSGGEPSMQPEAALDLLKRAKEKGINSVIETCGYGGSKFFEEALSLGAAFYYDIKTLDSKKHITLTGKPLDIIINNLEFLMKNGAKIVIRIPLIPGFNDSEKELELLSAFLKENKEKYDHAEIMKYHNLGMSKAKAIFKEYQAPKDNATKDDAMRWIEKLSSGDVKIIFSDK